MDRKRQPEQDSQDRKAGTGELGQESQKDRQDSTARIADRTAWTGEPGQNREDKSVHESNVRTAASGKPWTRLLVQGSWHRPTKIGQPGYDSQDRTAGTGHPGQDSWDRTAGTGQPEKTVRTVHPGQETEDNTARTGQQGEDKEIGQP